MNLPISPFVFIDEAQLIVEQATSRFICPKHEDTWYNAAACDEGCHVLLLYSCGKVEAFSLEENHDA